MSYEQRQTQSSPKVYVSNLSVAFTEDDLRKQFEKFGSIESLTLRQKDTFSFAFIEFKSVEDATKAIQEMNRKSIDGKEIKVEFSRSNGRRDFATRGRYNDRGGDRGSYRGRDDRDNGFRKYDDRGPRRDFGDRPKGCFNCNKEGHFARDCTQPRKPRQFGGDRDRNDRDRNDRNRNDRGDERKERRRSRSRSNDRHKKHRKRSSSSSRS